MDETVVKDLLIRMMECGWFEYGERRNEDGEYNLVIDGCITVTPQQRELLNKVWEESLDGRDW